MIKSASTSIYSIEELVPRFIQHVKPYVSWRPEIWSVVFFQEMGLHRLKFFMLCGSCHAGYDNYIRIVLYLWARPQDPTDSKDKLQSGSSRQMAYHDSEKP